MDKALEKFTEGLGLRIKSVEESEEFHVKIAFLPVGEVLVELIEPIGLGGIQDFLQKHGEGLHHICYRVSNINEAIKEFGTKLKMRDKEPRPGGGGSKVAFLDPQSLFNVETELVERGSEVA